MTRRWLMWTTVSCFPLSMQRVPFPLDRPSASLSPSFCLSFLASSLLYWIFFYPYYISRSVYLIVITSHIHVPSLLAFSSLSLCCFIYSFLLLAGKCVFESGRNKMHANIYYILINIVKNLDKLLTSIIYASLDGHWRNLKKYFKYLNNHNFDSTRVNEDKQGTKTHIEQRREMWKREEDMDKDGGGGKNTRPKGHSE